MLIFSMSLLVGRKLTRQNPFPSNIIKSFGKISSVEKVFSKDVMRSLPLS